MAEYDLISKTALLKHLDMAIECKGCPRNADKELYKCVHNPIPQRCTCSEIAQICIRITDFEVSTDVQPINRWVSVKDRLPDEPCECLGVVDGEVTEVSYSPKQMGYICVWSMCDADGFRPLPDDAVTHWMPLPEPPQD
jgi:hypothetical protein